MLIADTAPCCSYNFSFHCDKSALKYYYQQITFWKALGDQHLLQMYLNLLDLHGVYYQVDLLVCELCEKVSIFEDNFQSIVVQHLFKMFTKEKLLQDVFI